MFKKLKNKKYHPIKCLEFEKITNISSFNVYKCEKENMCPHLMFRDLKNQKYLSMQCLKIKKIKRYSFIQCLKS